MKVLVDTCIWSKALRRRKLPSRDRAHVDELEELIRELRAVIIGPVRQEVLCGIREEAQYRSVRNRLRAFPDLPIDALTYETAAAFFNLCRRKGVQGSNTDFLICAAAQRYELSIFTTDEDFVSFHDIMGVTLHRVRYG